MKKSLFFMMALLVGMSFVCQAQTTTNKRETPKEKAERLKMEKATKDSLAITSTITSYKMEVEKLKKEKEDLQKVNNDLRIQADERASLERKIQMQEQEKENLKALANANKADADSAYKQLLALKMENMQAENKNTETINIPVFGDNLKQQENLIVSDSAKKASVDSIKTAPVANTKAVVEVKKTTAQAKTLVIATMKKGQNWVPAKEKKFVAMPQKGTIVDDGQVVRIRKSDLETGKFDKQIAYFKSKGREIEEVQK